MARKKLFLTSFIVIFNSMYTTPQTQTPANTQQPINDINNFFPQSPQEIVEQKDHALKQALQRKEAIVALNSEERTFENTVKAYDTLYYEYKKIYYAIHALNLVSPHTEIQLEAQKQDSYLKKRALEIIEQNPELCAALNDYAQKNAQKENLNSVQKYYLKDILEGHQRKGLNLPDQQRKKILEIEKELAELETIFEDNISKDKKTIAVPLTALSGLDTSFIESLPKTEKGLYILGTDYPTVNKILSSCSNGQTRKAVYEIFNSRAYPENVEVLNKIIALRHELATMLNFESYAHLNLDDQMIKNPESAERFLYDLLEKVNAKEALEYEQLIKELPEGVTLSPDGKVYPWDRTYLTEYNKRNFNLNENLIAEYFPFDHTFEQLLDIYHQFLNVDFKEEKVDTVWHPDVKVISVWQNNKLSGYLFLDLHPRPNKFTHACEIPVANNYKNNPNPAIAVVIANLPKATPDKPALLKRTDVRTFFHEFGHALHSLLGDAEIASLSGTSVKMDFVEMPSKMLEHWLLDEAILKKVSCHYKTNKPLSDQTIQTITQLKNISSGYETQRQIFYALLSLEYFKKEADKNIHDIFRAVHHKVQVHNEFYEDSHTYASFGHLTEYGARYYSYLYSRVFAADVFDKIRSHGLLNSEIGVKYKNTILTQGGSKDPNELLFDFLERKPNSDAFMRDLGL